MFNETLGDGIPKTAAWDPFIIRRNMGLYLLEPCRRNSPAGAISHLESIVGRRVMGSRYVDGSRSSIGYHRV